MVLIKLEVGETHRGATLAGDVGPPVGGCTDHLQFLLSSLPVCQVEEPTTEGAP